MIQTILRSNRCPDPVILVWENTGIRSSGSEFGSGPKPGWLSYHIIAPPPYRQLLSSWTFKDFNFTVSITERNI